MVVLYISPARTFRRQLSSRSILNDLEVLGDFNIYPLAHNDLTNGLLYIFLSQVNYTKNS